MLLEIIAAVVLIHGCSILSQLIERRRDVLYYVSRPDPRDGESPRGARVEPPRRARV
jgi:hypothetical protein